MKKQIFSIFTIVLICLSTSCNNKEAEDGISIDWVDSMNGDYSFTEKWSYDVGIYRNDDGQLVCDGICNPEIDNMVDDNGKIIKDSLNRYYQLVDTTHFHHTIECEAQCYEWAGTDDIVIQKLKGDSVQGYTLCNPATHSSLQFTIINNKCIPQIVLNSIASPGSSTYKSIDKEGYIKIDRKEWEKGMMKAEFSFTFNEPNDQEYKMWWKGRIYAKIN